ncbi:protein-methionine-sulfoxide reductase heme-binding subunit MsrQ [Niveispirillum irakense]|uniref:protein-methionine-sulfoxide reductase heme-binding subunit MsrQ n=1 Tax=Niveispirillum irakense TaxID=34011 RepID=UPI0003F80158|nr:protein-methionine-sulfoxide reductase heme-binding subunit MsrQ [Niveispirillum irakense]
MAALPRWLRQPSLPDWPLYPLGFIPAIWLFVQAVTDNLGADPAKALERGLGEWALRLIILGLAITPLRQVAGINWVRYRRAIGLLAFFYVLLHLITYMVLDQGLDWTAIGADILRRPYITIGMLGFLLLLPLALTSTNAMIRRLGGARWRRLHRLVYPAAFAGAAHYLLLVKSWPLEPIIYAAIIVALLAWRLVPVGKAGGRAERA